MKTIIAGSRTLNSYDLAAALARHPHPITEVVCGCARGIDRCGFDIAREHGTPVAFFPAWADQHDWAFFAKKPDEVIWYPRGGYSGWSKSFGMQRNKKMAEYAEAAIIVWDGTSPGSPGMRDLAEREGLVLTVYRPPHTHKLALVRMNREGA